MDIKKSIGLRNGGIIVIRGFIEELRDVKKRKKEEEQRFLFKRNCNKDFKV